jgi:hypothetical protein
MMSEEELLRPSDQINFKVQVNGQVQVLSLKLCSVKYIVEVVYVKLHIFISHCLNILKIISFLILKAIN